MNLFNKTLSYVKGHKTIIFMTLANVAQMAVKYEVLPDNKYINFGIGITLGLGGGSLISHYSDPIKKLFKK